MKDALHYLPKTFDGVPCQAGDAIGPTVPRPEEEGARRRRVSARQDCAAVTSMGITASEAADSSVRTHGRRKESVFLGSMSKVALSSRVSPSGSALKSRNKISRRNNKANNKTDSKSISGGSSSGTTATRLGRGPLNSPQLHGGAMVDGASPDSLYTASCAGPTAFQDSPDQRESKLATFRARLDDRIDGISIPCASKPRVRCTGGELKNAARWDDVTDGQRRTPSSAALSANTSTTAEKQPFNGVASTPPAVSIVPPRIGVTFPKHSRSVALARAPVAEGDPVGLAAAEEVSENGAAWGSASCHGFNRLTEEPVNTNRGIQMWEWEKVRVDWNLKKLGPLNPNRTPPAR